MAVTIKSAMDGLAKAVAKTIKNIIWGMTPPGRL